MNRYPGNDFSTPWTPPAGEPPAAVRRSPAPPAAKKWARVSLLPASAVLLIVGHLWTTKGSDVGPTLFVLAALLLIGAAACAWRSIRIARRAGASEPVAAVAVMLLAGAGAGIVLVTVGFLVLFFLVLYAAGWFG